MSNEAEQAGIPKGAIDSTVLTSPRQPEARAYLALDFVVGLGEIATDIARDLRLVQSQIRLCHFGNELWESL
ncbi:MAG: hypothetical protein ACK4UN_20030 [Limisphaerales bacterium]